MKKPSGNPEGFVIGLAGFEPTTSCTPSEKAGKETPEKQADLNIGEVGCSNGCTKSPETTMIEPDLLRVIQAWDKMPGNMKAVIAGMAGLTLPIEKPKPIAQADDQLP